MVCRLCKEEETQEHVMWRCCGSASIKEARQRETSTVTTVNPGKEGTCAARTERRGRGDGPYAVADSREARCGILGKPFVDALETSGVPRDDGAKIRKEVDAGSFEVWNSFNSSVHHQHDAVGADLVMTERTELLELAGPSVGVNTGIWPQSASSRASKWSLEKIKSPTNIVATDSH